MNMKIQGQWPERIGWMLLAATAAWGIITGVNYVMLDKRPPISDKVPLLITIMTEPPILEGQDITVRFTRDKVRNDCETLAIRKAISSTGQSFDLQSEQWNGLPAGTHATLTYETGTLWAGDYMLDIGVHFICPGGLTFFTQFPLTPFRIEKADYIPPVVEQMMIIEDLKDEIDQLQQQVDTLPLEEGEEE